MLGPHANKLKISCLPSCRHAECRDVLFEGVDGTIDVESCVESSGPPGTGGEMVDDTTSHAPLCCMPAVDIHVWCSPVPSGPDVLDGHLVPYKVHVFAASDIGSDAVDS